MTTTPKEFGYALEMFVPNDLGTAADLKEMAYKALAHNFEKTQREHPEWELRTCQLGESEPRPAYRYRTCHVCDGTGCDTCDDDGVVQGEKRTDGYMGTFFWYARKP